MSDQKKESTCWGCNEGILNQQGHMDIGGCLYDEPIDNTPVLKTEVKTEVKSATAHKRCDTDVSKTCK